MNNNGHANGKQKALTTAEGVDALGKIMPNADNCRSAIVTLFSQLKADMDRVCCTPERAEAVMKVLFDISQNSNSRQQVRACEAYMQSITKMYEMQVRMAESLDKAGRLDEGTPTERVVYDVRIPEARNRISE